jgi:Secreted and surface protein containing fasciclin-like repeats
MKRFIQIIGLFTVATVYFSCAKPDTNISLKDNVKFSIYGYITDHSDNYSSFLEIVNVGGLAEILNAYNPERNTEGYTLFLPNNEAINIYLQENGYSSLSMFLKDTSLVKTFCRYHVLRKKYLTDDFPYGAFDKLTLTNDQLTVSTKRGADTSFFVINSMAPVIEKNIKTANGYIHVISRVLEPLTYTTYDWFTQHQGYSIFKAALDLTGLKSVLSINKKQPNVTAITVLAEADSIFAKSKIYSLSDLIKYVNPTDSSFTSPSNKLYNFVGYHIISGGYYLNQFEAYNASVNFNTYSDIPINIDSRGLELMMDTKPDTIIVDTTKVIKTKYIGINYDYSNVVTLSGVLHFVNNVLYQKQPSSAVQDYGFTEGELFLDSLTKVATAGSYLIEDSTRLHRVKYDGGELTFVTGYAISNYTINFLEITGNFSISYRIPKILPGVYNVNLSVGRGDSRNAVVQLYIDGIEVGRQQDLTVIPQNYSSFGFSNTFPIGTVRFFTYGEHVVSLKAFVPGRLQWNRINFTPNTNIQ